MSIDKIQSILACEIECGVFEQHVLPALNVARHALSVDAQPVGVAGTMPGTDGFTMAAFKASEVPVGTPLYASAQSEGLRKDAVPVANEDCDARIRKWRDAFDAMHRRAMKAEARIASERGSALEGAAIQWDGCFYEGVGERIDIGAAIRALSQKDPE
jgi:hypothetical protein